jgi:hypothetical protein
MLGGRKYPKPVKHPPFDLVPLDGAEPLKKVRGYHLEGVARRRRRLFSTLLVEGGLLEPTTIIETSRAFSATKPLDPTVRRLLVVYHPITTHFSNYAWNCMPQGIAQAPAHLQKCMDSVLEEYLDEFVMVYLDDIIVYSNTWEEHMDHIRRVLSKLREYGLQAKAPRPTLPVRSLAFRDSIKPLAVSRSTPPGSKRTHTQA